MICVPLMLKCKPREPCNLVFPTLQLCPRTGICLIVDLKDCFFTLPLHPNDMPRLAFTLPATNREGPASRYEWTVLPQGMENSPTLYQMYVDAALKPVQTQWPKTIYHYMDDILVAQPDPITPQQELLLTNQLKLYGLIIAPEKVQRTPVWKC